MRQQAGGTFLRAPVNAFTVAVRVTMLVGWMAAIFVFSAQPGQASDVPSDAIAGYVQGMGTSMPADLVTFFIRKSAHAFAFLGLGVLTFLVLRLTTLSLRGVATASLAFVIVFAISDETHQLFVPGRSGELRDVFIDVTSGAVGALSMIAAHHLVLRQQRRARPRTAD